MRISLARRSRSTERGFGFEDGAVLSADGLAFLGELSAVLLAVAKDGDETAGACEKAIDGPGSENGAFAELARPMQAEDAGGVVGEDGDLVRAQMHALTVGSYTRERKDLCTTCRRHQ